MNRLNTHVNGLEVSTIKRTYPHPDDGSLFETIVFNSYEEQVGLTERYMTENEARWGHTKTVAHQLREKTRAHYERGLVTLSTPDIVARREEDAAIASAARYFIEHRDGPFPARHDIENFAAGHTMEDVSIPQQKAQAILLWWDKLDEECERRRVKKGARQ